MHRSLTFVAILAISACRGDAPRAAVSSDGSGSGSGSAEVAGSCSETPLFPARSTGDSGNDLYRKIQIDPATHDVYFSDLHTIYRAPGAGGEPQVVLPRAKGGGQQFWLVPDRLLLAGNDVWLDKVHAVLFSTPRGGGDLQPIIDVPANDGRMFHMVRSVAVVGDSVFWDLDEGHPGAHDETHTFLTTSWTQPGEPKVLYKTRYAIAGDLFVAGGRAYIVEDRGKNDEAHETVIDLASGAVSPVDPALGGHVVGGDESWILVRRTTSKDGKVGTIRMRPDGSQVAQVGTGIMTRLATRGDVWALAEHDSHTNTTEVSVIAPSGEKKVIGCVNGDATVHAIGLGDDAVYVSVFRKSKATILRFPRA